ncbi:tetratricopeptide repeat-containing sensor histidine kinase [Hymenobacter terricola]|uniref:tetratricopeptide repeat-containing sensor histidine kinase n=1 Tax=Hymenobacter terricola TaxID=2819236 RepID=UPI001B3079AC|nr:histidine kinase [Hymenobacter terricola]
MKNATTERLKPGQWQPWLAGWLALLLLSSGGAGAQGLPLPLKRLVVVRDSLGRLLATERRPDTLRVVHLNTLAFVLRTNDPPQAQALARQGLALARRLHFAPGLVEAHFNMGYNYRARSQYDSAIYHSRQALAWAIRTHNRYTQTRAYYNLCRIYTEQGNYAAALGPSLDGLTLAHAIHNSRAELLQLVQAGRIELGLGEYATARAYIEEARRLLPAARDTGCTGFVYLGFGDISRQQGQWQAARRAYTRTLGAYRVVYNERGLLPVELNIAEMTERLGDYPAARRVSQGLLYRARATGTPEQVAQAALLLARTWLPTRADSARRYAALSLATAAPLRLRPTARDAAQALAQASDQLGQGHAAYRYQLLAAAYADTLSGEDTRRRLAAVQARAARSRTQTQLSLLQQQVRLRSQQQELERLRARQQLLGTVGAAGALLLLGSGLFWQYRRRVAWRLASRDATLRQRLAADLHDDVGSLLTQISLQSDLLRETVASPDQTLARLNRLSDTSRRAARQMADVVWGLHASSAELPEVLAHMRDHAHEVLAPQELAIDFAVSEAAAAQRPSLATCQTLYLIFKEALHNVVKHARGATLVTIRVSHDAGQLCLSVRDNAAGPAPTARPGGHGLANMRRRAEAVGGALHHVAEATGFGVVACLPE